jgi:hypothetical protein
MRLLGRIVEGALLGLIYAGYALATVVVTIGVHTLIARAVGTWPAWAIMAGTIGAYVAGWWLADPLGPVGTWLYERNRVQTIPTIDLRRVTRRLGG